MKATQEALQEGFLDEGPAGWAFYFGEGYELRFEPLLWDEQMYVALYQNQGLLTEKVVVKPGFVREAEGVR